MSVWGEKGRGQRELMRGGRTGVLLCRSILKVCSTVESCTHTQRRERRNSCAPQYPRQSGEKRWRCAGVAQVPLVLYKRRGETTTSHWKKLLAGSKQKRLTTPKEPPPQPACTHIYIGRAGPLYTQHGIRREERIDWKWVGGRMKHTFSQEYISIGERKKVKRVYTHTHTHTQRRWRRGNIDCLS
jgi:hypothetical protein